LPNIEIIKKILQIMEKDESHIEFVKDRPGHDRKYDVDFSKIHNELGWQPEHSFEEYLVKTIDWYKTHENWWKDVKSGAYKDYYKKQYGII
jgi:dTDP-glucose 4,6-dehydratase